MERETFRKNEINRCKRFVLMKLCNECGSRMSVETCEHLALFHPQIITLVQEISNKIKSFPDVKRRFPSMDCLNLCAAKVIANRLIDNLAIFDSSSLVLIEQLSNKITSVSDRNIISSNQKYCNMCSLRFLSTRLTIAHLMLHHPECLALVQFLRCRPLSELNFQKDVVALSKTKTQELVRVITDPTVLASCQPFVKLEKLPSHLYQECITKGYVEMKENTGTRSLFGAQPNSRLNGVGAEVMKKIIETVENSRYRDASNITVIIVPKKNFKSPQNNSDSERSITACHKNIKKATLPTTSKILPNKNVKKATLPTTSKIIRNKNVKKATLPTTSKILSNKNVKKATLPTTSKILPNKNVKKTTLPTTSKIIRNKNVKNANTTLPTTSKIIRYGVEDLERDRLMKQQEKEKITKKERMLKKMLAKYHEKETKKEVLYRQKKLTRYVMRHGKVLFKLKEDLINARKQITSRLYVEQLLERVDFYVAKRNCKVRKAVRYLLKKLFDAIEKVPAIKDTKNCT